MSDFGNVLRALLEGHPTLISRKMRFWFCLKAFEKIFQVVAHLTSGFSATWMQAERNEEDRENMLNKKKSRIFSLAFVIWITKVLFHDYFSLLTFFFFSFVFFFFVFSLSGETSCIRWYRTTQGFSNARIPRMVRLSSGADILEEWVGLKIVWNSLSIQPNFVLSS